jgi:serine/threonine protein kinase
MVMIQCLERMETLHGKGFIHRDIKPENFLVGFGKKAHIIYSIDFGLTKRFLDPRTGNHITYKENRPVVGTVRYSSLNAQVGNE